MQKSQNKLSHALLKQIENCNGTSLKTSLDFRIGFSPGPRTENANGCLMNCHSQNFLFWDQKCSEMSKNRMIFYWFDENKFTHEENSQSLKEVNNAKTLEPVLNYMLNVINEKTRLIR